MEPFQSFISSSLKPKKDETSLLGMLGYCSAGILGYGVYRFVRQYMKWLCTPLRKLPGPKLTSFFMGVFPKIQKEPFLAPHKEWFANAGPETSLIHYTTLLGRSSILVLDKEIVRTILTTPAGKANPRFEKRMVLIKSVLGSGLLVLEGQDWMRHRRILQPAFNTQVLRETLNQVVPEKVNELIGYWKQGALDEREIDANSHLSALTLDIIGPTAFSHEFHGLQLVREWATDAAKENDQVVAELDDPFMKAIANAFKFDIFSMLFIILDKMRSKKRLARKFLNAQTDKIVADVATLQHKEDANKKRSILSTMLDAQDTNVPGDTLSLEEIRDEVKTCMYAFQVSFLCRMSFLLHVSNMAFLCTFMEIIELRCLKPQLSSRGMRYVQNTLQGYTPRVRDSHTCSFLEQQTTSTWCYWAIYALTKHPEIQEKVYKDVIQHAPRSSLEKITLKHTDKMEYLGAFLQEVLRLYPPAGIIFRFNRRKETLGDAEIPAHTRIAISPHIMHRHPKYWDDPEAFQPERWINVSQLEVERRRFAFIPFSTGGRNCIGQRFATMEVHLIIAAVVRAFSLQVAPSQKDVEHTFTSHVTMKAKPALCIAVNARWWAEDNTQGGRNHAVWHSRQKQCGGTGVSIACPTNMKNAVH